MHFTYAHHLEKVHSSRAVTDQGCCCVVVLAFHKVAQCVPDKADLAKQQNPVRRLEPWGFAFRCGEKRVVENLSRFLFQDLHHVSKGFCCDLILMTHHNSGCIQQEKRLHEKSLCVNQKTQNLSLGFFSDCEFSTAGFEFSLSRALLP